MRSIAAGPHGPAWTLTRWRGPEAKGAPPSDHQGPAWALTRWQGPEAKGAPPSDHQGPAWALTPLAGEGYKGPPYPLDLPVFTDE
jgi:hypothetical protein